MQVGDYVRFKDGDIGKISSIFEHKRIGKIIRVEDYCYIDFKEKDIKESNPRIIKLIQQGDYVNGHKVFNIETSHVFDNSHNYIGEKISLDVGNDMYGSTIYIEEKDIKSIVTKEQFENMEYTIESDKN